MEAPITRGLCVIIIHIVVRPNKKVIVSTVLFLIAFGGSIAVLAENVERNHAGPDQKTNEATNIILFYGNGCSHCARVEQFVQENNIQSKVPFEQKEVYYNQQNAGELALKAAACGMPTDSIGVPFLWNGENCIIGDQPIIDFFKQKANIQ
jgi:glutaredoxin